MDGAEHLIQQFDPDVRLPDVSLFNPIITGPRGGLSIDKITIMRYLKSCHICYDNRWMMFDGRVYTPITDADLDRMIYDCC